MSVDKKASKLMLIIIRTIIIIIFYKGKSGHPNYKTYTTSISL